MTEKSEKLLNDISRVVDDIFSLEQLKERLKSGKQLRIKFGADVTAPFLHLGHAVNLWMMRRFQDDGHKVIFLIGDFTTRIGDPTGKSQTRPQISKKEIEKNGRLFVEQIEDILITDDPKLFEVRRNSEWFDPMPLDQFLSLMAMTTHARLISRDMFQKRMKAGEDIYSHELIYPILQGYDSFMLKSDLTIVGSDQLFNEMMGKYFQEKFDQAPQTIITSKITAGLTGGAKQSKSLNNYVALADSSKDKYGKLMGLNDNQIVDWMRVYTDIPLEEISVFDLKLKEGKNPVEFKHILAHEVVRRYHGESTANHEREWFVKTFSKKEFPENAPEVEIDQDKISLLEVLKRCKGILSNSEFRRLAKQGAISIDGEKINTTEQIVTLEQGKQHKLKIGKRSFFKIIYRG